MTLPGCSWPPRTTTTKGRCLSVIDLFCGAGGFSEGLRQAGHEIILAVDQDETALATHEANHPRSEHWLEDIRELAQLPPSDVVIGSPPCIQFSRGNPKRSLDLSLCMEFLRLALTSRPRFFVMENVPEAGAVLPLKGLVVDAAEFGVPQRRIRWFGGLFPAPRRTRSGFRPSVKEAVGRPVNVRLRNGFEQRIRSDKPSPTVVAHWAKRGSAVPFTLEELKALMGFPEHYRLQGSRTSQIRQVGNAVPPPVARAFGLSMGQFPRVTARRPIVLCHPALAKSHSGD